VLLFEVAPVLVVYPLAFNSASYLQFPPPGVSTRWFHSYFTDSSWTHATIHSLVVALGATAIAVVVGTLASVALVRRRMRGAGAITLFIMLPMVMPTIVISIGLYALFTRLGLVGTTIGLVFAHALLGTPFVVINVSARLRTMSRSIELAAASLGASPFRVFLEVTAPLIRPALFGGALFAFLASWDEFIIAYFAAGVNGQTLPLRIFAGIRFAVDPTAAAASAMLVSLVIVGAAIMALTTSLHSRRRAEGRARARAAQLEAANA
jgi:putative spermidine/putrescine transport system permease protein